MAEWGFVHNDFEFDDAGFSLYIEGDVVSGVTVFVRGYNDLSNPNSAASRVNRAAELWFRNHESG